MTAFSLLLRNHDGRQQEFSGPPRVPMSQCCIVVIFSPFLHVVTLKSERMAIFNNNSRLQKTLGTHEPKLHELYKKLEHPQKSSVVH